VSERVHLAGIEKSFGRNPVLEGIDLDMPAGSRTVVLGPSGCGKTTLLRIIGGFERADRGTVKLGSRVLADDTRWVPPERRRIGYVAQEGALFPHLDVAANVSFGLKWSARRRRRGVDELLTLVGLDPKLADRAPHQLSGGQQQRVALARALAPEPAVVLLDEPFASLDTALRDSTRTAVVSALASRGATTVLVTHDQGEALSIADQVAVMRRGRLVQVSSPFELYRAPADVETARFVGDATILSARFVDGVADTVLGRLAVSAEGERRGAGDVMVRPEQLVLGSPTSGAGVAAVVTTVTFYGHDAIVRARLDDGSAVIARVAGHQAPAPGDRVGLSVTGDVHAFEMPTGGHQLDRTV
jgi:iron(III) transport system ATP-binding protein